ncbi:MAG: hypothetical protein Q9204_007323 [Flavoplaca sp. TL-2023a]
MRALVFKAEEATNSASTASDIPLKSPQSESNTVSTPPNFDDFSDEDEHPSPDPSILQAFKEEFALVFRTLLYVLRSWIDFPFKLMQITILEASRAWNYWLGLPVQPRDYVWEFDLGKGAPGRGEKGEL